MEKTRKGKLGRWIKIGVLVGIWFVPVKPAFATTDGQTGTTDAQAAGSLIGMACQPIVKESGINPVKLFGSDDYYNEVHEHGGC